MRTAASPESRLKAKALACIAQREHSRAELKAKLLAYLDRQQRAASAAGAGTGDPGVDEPGDEGHADRAVDALLDWLVERDLLSVERFIEGRVRVRAERFGFRRVRQEIERHGLALDEPTARELRQSEPARAYALWVRRFGVVVAEPAQRAKQMRFLLSRGFDAEVARRVVSGAFVAEDEASETRHVRSD